ncbi:MAG TPA: M20 family metallopeptidase [Thermoleophilia bacterium]|nr:M20 family metallopeptidase [Thermoleophilia bacterium]
MRADVNAEEVVALTQDLVRIDTRNPPGGERAAAEVCRAALARFGATFAEIEPAPGRVSLLATIPAPDGNERGPTLIVNGHLDVVPIDPAAWTHAPFGAELVDGRIYGRGTTDMKGGIAAAIAALSTLARAGKRPAGEVIFHLVADEERGGALGTEVLAARDLIHGDACLVPEPTSLAVGVAERGLLVVTITTLGQPAHGSRPREGVSAIETAAEVVRALHAADFGDPPHPLLGTPTANVGQIEGGSGHNTVAEQCRIVVDRRLLPGATRDEAVARLRAKIDTVTDPNLRYELEVTTFGEASEMPADEPFPQLVSRAVAKVTGETPSIVGMPFTTDARFVRNQAGIPAVVCGPGDIALAHGNDEWVSVERLVDATAIYAEIMAGLGSLQAPAP